MTAELAAENTSRVNSMARSCSRGKRVVRLLLGITIVGAAVSAYLGAGYLVDSWWIWRLSSSDQTARKEAVKKLGERKCLRAVPHLLRLIEADPDEGIDVTEHWETRGNWRTQSKYRTATPLVFALWEMGEAAVPVVERLSGSMAAAQQRKMRQVLAELRDRDLPVKPGDGRRHWGAGSLIPSH